MASKQILVLLFAVVCAAICRPTEKEESSIHKHQSIGIVHIRLISDTGIDDVVGVFDPEALERSLEKMPEKIPSSELGKQPENPLDEKKISENLENPAMQKEGLHKPILPFDERESEKNPIYFPEEKEKNLKTENPLNVKDVENLSPEGEKVRWRRELLKNPLQTDLDQPKLLPESRDKLQQEHKASEDVIKKPQAPHESRAGHRSESKHLDPENVNLDKQKLEAKNLHPDERKPGSANVNVDKSKLGSENVKPEEAEEPEQHRPGSENVNLDKSKLGSENVKPEDPKEHPDVLKEPEEPREHPDVLKESEEQRQSPSFPSILLPPRAMSKRKRSLLDGFPMGDVGMYDARSPYRLPGSTDIEIGDDRPRYGMSGGYDDMSRYRTGDSYGDPRYQRPGSMDRPIYDDRYGSYGSDSLVDIRMK